MQHFKTFGEVKSTSAPVKQEHEQKKGEWINENRGYGFVSFYNADEARKAQQTMNGFVAVDKQGVRAKKSITYYTWTPSA